VGKDRATCGPVRRAAPPDTGVLVWDMQRQAVGVVMDTQSGRMYLRPPGGGCEWETLPGDVQPADGNRRTE
jgi:hypothetical protein